MIFKVVCLWIQAMAVSVFVLGFFPIKAPLKGKSPSIKEEEVGEFPSLSRAWRRRVGQVVIVVIDALRADFVFNDQELERMGLSYRDNFKFSRGLDEKRLLSQKKYSTFSSLGLLAQAHSPTVTLPRLKAISTGSIPGYVDVIINFGSKSLDEDSLIRQWEVSSRNIVFYGDDTWLRLFPKSFLRSEGTSSFFVSDFYEVDSNVTRNLPIELEKLDWDVMILHYLGLDHIGHVHGPGSGLIPGKLHEMESVIKACIDGLEIKKWKEGLPPLILVLGDHGMADVGGHGGSTIPETMTPVIALSPALQNISDSFKVIQQTDLATTLAWLTGVPIPRNNMGGLIGPLISRMENNSEYLRISALYNLKQVSRVLEKNSLLSYNDLMNEGKSMREILAHIENIQSVLFDNVLEYNYVYMGFGIATLLFTIILQGALEKQRMLKDAEGCSLIICLHILRLLSLASTSFIEEEHQVAYFLAMTLFLSLEPSNALLILMLLYRAARTLNQTGNKWVHLPDVSDWLSVHREARDCLFVLSLLGTLILRIKETGFTSGLKSLILLILVALQKVADKSFGPAVTRNFLSERGVIEAQIVYFGSLVLLIARILYLKYFTNHTSRRKRELLFDGLFDSFLPCAFILNRPENSCLFLLSIIAESFLWSRIKNHANGFKIAFVYSLMGIASFFHQGNCTSSLSKVDVTFGYVGVNSFNSFIVGPLLLISTYSGPLLWLFLLYKRLDKKKHEEVLTSTLFLLGSEALLYMIIITAQRFHLFVWSVFSPKLLYLGTYYLVLTFMHSFLTFLMFIFV